MNTQISLRNGFSGAILALTLLLVPLVDAAPAAKKSCFAKLDAPKGAWYEIPVPLEGKARSIAVHPSDPKKIYVASTYSVMGSADGGCTWREIFSIPPDEPMPQTGWTTPPTSAIVQVKVGGGPGGASIYVLVVSHRPGGPGGDAGTGVASAYLASSIDDGGKWTVQAFSEPTTVPWALHGASAPRRLWVAPSDREVLYASAVDWAPGGATSDRLYATENAGTSWESRSTYANEMIQAYDYTAEGECIDGESPPCNGVPFYFMKVDPDDPRVLWSKGTHGLYRSNDGGEVWERFYAENLSGEGDFDLYRQAGSAPLLAFSMFDGIHRSTDGGKSWSVQTPPKEVSLPTLPSLSWIDGTRMIGSNSSGCIQVTDTSSRPRVYLLELAEWIDITPPNIGEGDVMCPLDAARLGARPAFYLLVNRPGDAPKSSVFMYRP